MAGNLYTTRALNRRRRELRAKLHDPVAQAATDAATIARLAPEAKVTQAAARAAALENARIEREARMEANAARRHAALAGFDRLARR